MIVVVLWDSFDNAEAINQIEMFFCVRVSLHPTPVTPLLLEWQTVHPGFGKIFGAR